MKSHKKYLLAFAVFLLGFSLQANAAVVVIANPASEIANASADELKRLFLGKTREVGGQRVTPVDQDDSPARTYFYEVLIGKDSSQMRAYWSKLVFTGKGKPPAELGGDADVVAAIASDPELVGYVDSTAVTDGVVVLFELP